MASATINLPASASSGKYIDTKIEWNSVADHDANKSDVTAKLYVRKGDTTQTLTIATTGTWTYTLTVNGNSVSGTVSLSVLQDWVLVATKTVTGIAHGTNGEKTITIFGSVTAPSGTSFKGHKSSGSDTATLDTIPRESSVIVSDGVLGTEQTLTVVQQASGYTHTIVYSCGKIMGTVVTKSSSTSIKWTPPLTLAGQNTTGNSVSISLAITTYNGDKPVGTVKTTSFTARIPASVKPLATLALSDPTGYKTKYGGYVQGKSKLAVKLTGTEAQGAPIKSYRIRIGSADYSADSITVNLPSAESSLSIKGDVTDSRTRTGSDEEIITVLEYLGPRVTHLSVTRCTENGTPKADGSFAKATFTAIVTSLNKKNTAVYKIEYRKEGTNTWSSLDVNDATGNYNPTSVSGIFASDTGAAYQIRIAVTDGFGTVYSSLRTVPVAFALVQADTTGTGLAVGQMATEPNVFAVGLPTKMNPGEVPYALDVTGDVRMKNAHGYVYGLGKAQVNIPEGADFNTYTDFGVYAVSSNDKAKTIANCPGPYAGTLIVSSSNGSGVNSGNYVYILQTYRTYDGRYEFFRGISTDNTDDYRFQKWQCRSTTAWQSLGISNNVSPSTYNYGRAGQGCYYRVVDESHVYVAFNCAISFAGSTIQINATALPEGYRPSRSVYTLCAVSGRALARVCVNTSGNVFVEFIQSLSSGESTNAYEITWIDGYIDFWVA